MHVYKRGREKARVKAEELLLPPAQASVLFLSRYSNFLVTTYFSVQQETSYLFVKMSSEKQFRDLKSQ